MPTRTEPPRRKATPPAGETLVDFAPPSGSQRIGAVRKWHALNWNDPALSFYERLGAQRLSEWELHRLSGEALARVAAGGRRSGGPEDAGGAPA